MVEDRKELIKANKEGLPAVLGHMKKNGYVPGAMITYCSADVTKYFIVSEVLWENINCVEDLPHKEFYPRLNLREIRRSRRGHCAVFKCVELGGKDNRHHMFYPLPAPNFEEQRAVFGWKMVGKGVSKKLNPPKEWLSGEMGIEKYFMKEKY